MMDTTEATKLNAITFKKEMSWVSDKIDQRLDLFFEKRDLEYKKILPPDIAEDKSIYADYITCLLYTSPSPRDKRQCRMPSSA